PEVLEALDVVVIGVPMDLGVTNRAGARLGPRAVRAIERIGPYEHFLRVAPARLVTPRSIGTPIQTTSSASSNSGCKPF
ncbi:arginase family protein, partial [Rhizobium leguminosarum]|uniref:arginase family protein n=1 Tax=Rhizobium leguminosarum TaxID=384 RepID=UPI003F984AC1